MAIKLLFYANKLANEFERTWLCSGGDPTYPKVVGPVFYLKIVCAQTVKENNVRSIGRF